MGKLLVWMTNLLNELNLMRYVGWRSYWIDKVAPEDVQGQLLEAIAQEQED